MNKMYVNVKQTLVFMFLVLLVFPACQSLNKINITKANIDQSPKTQMEKDQKKIQKYIQSKGLTTSKTSKGIHYVIEKIGEGDHPTPYAVATVHYRGCLLYTSPSPRDS